MSVTDLAETDILSGTVDHLNILKKVVYVNLSYLSHEMFS
jgi:hypothetical protein